MAFVVTIRLSPLPNTPQLKQPRFKCFSNQRFEYIVRFLRKKLSLKDHESVFCYVNSVFSPSLDEGVGNLWRVSGSASKIRTRPSVAERFFSASRRAMSLWSLTASRRLLADAGIPAIHDVSRVNRLKSLEQ